MKSINFPPDKLFHLLTKVAPKTEDITSDESLEILIDLEIVLDHIKEQDKVEVFSFLFYVIDNYPFFPHLIDALRLKFSNELRVMKEVNINYSGRSNNDLANICASRFSGVEKD